MPGTLGALRHRERASGLTRQTPYPRRGSTASICASASLGVLYA